MTMIMKNGANQRRDYLPALYKIYNKYRYVIRTTRVVTLKRSNSNVIYTIFFLFFFTLWYSYF